MLLTIVNYANASLNMAAFVMPPLKQRKERIFRGIKCHLTNLTDEELRARYRFGRESIHYLVELLNNDLLRSTKKATGLSVEEQILIALRFYACGSFLQVIGDTLGYDKGTVSRVVEDVTNALMRRKDDFINWPNDEDTKNEIKCGFFERANFPNVLGCIDGTHVPIKGPGEDENAFVNRKGYHSINVQAVCDHKGNLPFFISLRSCLL